MWNKLTPKQARFVSEYLCDLNATQAAIRAGYSLKTAAVIGFENLRKPQIAEAVQLAQSKAAERNELSVDWVLQGLKSNIAEAALQDPYQGAVINKGLELIGKHIGMFQDAQQPAGTGPVHITVVYAGELPPGDVVGEGL